jgi:hypothetical protein
MTPTPANPENVPLDKIPEGWRLLHEEEYGCERILPCRIWRLPGSKAEFSSIFSNFPYQSRYTYITPDLPDNGQPWRAHKPGDPAPVEDGVNVDLVCRSGKIYTRQTSADWSALPKAPDSDIVFYRLHDPAPKHSSTSDRILDLLIVAGHVTAERVEQARKLAQM